MSTPVSSFKQAVTAKQTLISPNLRIKASGTRTGRFKPTAAPAAPTKTY